IGLYLSAADFNGDGKLDLLASDDTYWSDYATLLLGQGNGSFDWSDDFLQASGPTTVGDFNADGHPDLASASNYGELNGEVAIFLNDGDWSVPPPPPPPTPSLSINDITVTEGNAGVVAATFTVRLSVASTEPVMVNFATADGTAAGSDYQ